MEKAVSQEKVKHGLGFAWIFLLVAVGLSILTFIFAPILISSILFLGIFLPIILYILIYKWLDRWFAALVFSFSVWLNILVILIPLIGGILAIDLYRFSQDFSSQNKYIALDDNGLIFGVNLNNNIASNNDKKPFTILTKIQLSQLEAEILTKVNNKLIFVVDKSVFNSVDSITPPQLSITLKKEEIFKLLKSDDAALDTKNLLLNKASSVSLPPEIRNKISQQVNISSDDIKISLIYLMLQDLLQKKGTDYLVHELKQGKIKVYPERTSLNLLIALVPENVIGDLLPKSLDSIASDAQSIDSPINSKSFR